MFIHFLHISWIPTKLLSCVECWEHGDKSPTGRALEGAPSLVGSELVPSTEPHFAITAVSIMLSMAFFLALPLFLEDCARAAGVTLQRCALEFISPSPPLAMAAINQGPLGVECGSPAPCLGLEQFWGVGYSVVSVWSSPLLNFGPRSPPCSAFSLCYWLPCFLTDLPGESPS